MSADDSKILGVLLLIRHGDRQGFYQDPNDYTASNTAITPLGNVEELQLGTQLRSIYLNSSSPSVIPINNTIAQGTQYLIRADGGGERGVIFNSAVSLLQGLFPPTPTYADTLANGSNVVGPFGGYQYLQIASVDPNVDVSLEGYTSCNTFNTAISTFYNSTEFMQMQTDHSAFFNTVGQYLDGRPVNLQNMFNIFDYMNVQSIHDADFAKALPPTYLAQAHYLADYHENGVFSSPDINAIQNIAGQTMVPSILSGLEGIASPNNTVKLVYQAIAYKPFISLFSMMGVTEAQPSISGIVNYAAALALEVRQPASGGEPVVRMLFQNGTEDDGFKQLNFLNKTGDVLLSDLVNGLGPAGVNDTAHWCNVCSNTQDRGCAAITQARVDGAASVHLHQKINPVGAGFLGAGLTLAVVLAFFAFLFFKGMIGSSRGRPTKRVNSPGSDEPKV